MQTTLQDQPPAAAPPPPPAPSLALLVADASVETEAPPSWEDLSVSPPPREAPAASAGGRGWIRMATASAILCIAMGLGLLVYGLTAPEPVPGEAPSVRPGRSKAVQVSLVFPPEFVDRTAPLSFEPDVVSRTRPRRKTRGTSAGLGPLVTPLAPVKGAVAPPAGVEKGRITAAEIAAVRAGARGALQACYQRARRKDLGLSQAKAAVKLRVGDDGAVVEARVRSAESSTLGTCLSRVIRRWQFPPRGTQALAFSLVFQ